MEKLLIFSVVLGSIALVSAMAFNYARQEFSKKRRDYRMGRALRRSIAHPEGVRHVRMVQWQPCETSPVQFS